MPDDREEAIDIALRDVAALVAGDEYKADAAYFAEHKIRFERTLRRVTELCPHGGRVLDIGSHYLHLSAALRLLGYEVVAMDVGSFSRPA